MQGLPYTDEAGLSVIAQPDEMHPDSFIAYYLENKEGIEDLLQRSGAIKFRGVRIESLAGFQHIVDSISAKFLSYVDGNSPRTKLSGNVYTSTEYDKAQRITMHNELSYSAKWPNKLFFSCLQPAETGGETLLADSREILRRMDGHIVSEIRQRGITYIRNLHSGMGMGPSWQDTFETDDKQQLEEFCHACAVEYEWGNAGQLRIKQFSKGIIGHRNTREMVWFNQVDQFHPCHLGAEMFEILKMMYDQPENFPMYVRFGDGKEIDEKLIREIMKTIDEVTIAPVWQKNELLIVDNELVSHGRNSYTGDRSVLVAMSE
jgi:alpha-ketoglutarate-dependent taurine dioxygenase